MSGSIKLWNGSSWVRANSNNVRIWNGSNWTRPQARMWNGNYWENILEERKDATWGATWSQAYWSWGDYKAQNSWLVWTANHPTQGSYYPYHDYYDKGNEHGMIGFDTNTIRNELSGARVEATYVELTCVHCYYTYGHAVIGWHNSDGWQARFQESGHGDIARRTFYAKRWTAPDRQTFQVVNGLAEGIRDGWAKGLTCSGDNNWDHTQYMVYAGSDYGWEQKPKIRVIYWK